MFWGQYHPVSDAQFKFELFIDWIANTDIVWTAILPG
jgi:hypothetical protein